MEITAKDASRGVTCEEVVNGLSESFHALVKKAQFDSAKRRKKIEVTTAYHFNRSESANVPGIRLGEGIRRIDWLGAYTNFGGMERNGNLKQQEEHQATFRLLCTRI